MNAIHNQHPATTTLTSGGTTKITEAFVGEME